MVWWRRVDDEGDEPATSGDESAAPAAIEADPQPAPGEDAHRLSGSFSGDSYWNRAGGSESEDDAGTSGTREPAPSDGDLARAPSRTDAADSGQAPTRTQSAPPAPARGSEGFAGAAAEASAAEASATDQTATDLSAADENTADARAESPGNAPDTEARVPAAVPSDLPRRGDGDSVTTDSATPLPSAPPETVPDGTAPSPTNERHAPMADYQASLNEAMQIDGALGVALVDSQSGMALATAGNPDGLDLNVAAAGNSNVVQSKLRTMRDLGLNQKIEDILITLDSQYHIIRTFGKEEGLFLYLVLDKTRANLAMARFKLAGIEKQLVI